MNNALRQEMNVSDAMNMHEEAIQCRFITRSNNYAEKKMHF